MTPATNRAADRVVTAVDARRPAIVDVIRGARRSITLSLFRCNDEEILAELAAAVARGVAVEALVTSRAKGGRKKIEKLWRALEGIGADLHAYTDPVVKYHAKYLVADDGPAIVASLNFTRKCFKRTCDALVITYDPVVVADLRRLWAADCARGEMPPDLTDRLIVGPERARRQFTALVDQARASIRLIDAKLSDPDLVSLLNEKRAAGLAVEVFSARHVGALKSHGKIMVIDDRVAVIGSLALAALSIDFRREVAISVTEPAAVAEVLALFAELRGATGERAPSAGASGQALC
jgi:phosphatidylserine/phosphatidylglycerophosphate/cardiolipin synthase-like enzyme